MHVPFALSSRCVSPHPQRSSHFVAVVIFVFVVFIVAVLVDDRFPGASWGAFDLFRAHASPDADQRLLTISSYMLGQVNHAARRFYRRCASSPQSNAHLRSFRSDSSLGYFLIFADVKVDFLLLLGVSQEHFSDGRLLRKEGLDAPPSCSRPSEPEDTAIRHCIPHPLPF